MSEYISPQQKRAILDAATIRGDFTLASGARSTEKFEFDRIKTNSGLFIMSVVGLARCIKANVDFEEHDTMALVTMASGANRLGDPLADLLPLFHVPSRKDDEGNLYIPERIEGLPCIFVDDVYTTGSTFEKAKRQIGGKLLSAFVLEDRSGRVDPTLSNGERVYSVMQHAL